MPDYMREVIFPILRQKGDDMPVSAFAPDGAFPFSTAQYEKRGVAINVPEWIKENCIQCNQCAFVCPHATIRPFLATERGDGGRAGNVRDAAGRRERNCRGIGFRIQVYPARLHGMRQLRRHLPGQGVGTGDEADRDPGRGAGDQPQVRRDARLQGAPDEAGNAEGEPVPAAAPGVSRRLLRLRRKPVRPAGHPALRRADDDRQCHRLHLDLGRLGAGQPLPGERRGARPGVEQLPFRGCR